MKHRRTGFLLAFLLLQTLAACGDRGPGEFQLKGPAMGTTFTVTLVAANDVDLEHLRFAIHSVLDDADRRMSTYREDSELARFNRSRSTDWLAVSRELCDAVHLALEIGKLTSGAFDITVGPVVDLWGFGPGEAVTSPPSDDDIQLERMKTGLENVEADCENPAIRKARPDLRIDLSGFGKGRAADEVGFLLQEQGIFNFLVEIGGDLRVQGRKANGQEWNIAIETPDSQGRAIERVIQVGQNFVATSGDYRNFFEHDGNRYSHTIDPRTARPVTHDLASVTVVFDNGAIADAYATALMVLGPDAGMMLAERLGIDAYFLVRDGESLSARSSGTFEARFGL